MKFPNIIYSL